MINALWSDGDNDLCDHDETLSVLLHRRLGVLFPIIEFTFWTVVLRLWLRVLLGSFTLRVLGLRGAICIARVLLRSGLWRTRMARSLAGSGGADVPDRGSGALASDGCWSFWGARMRR